MYYHYGKWDPMFRGCPLLGGDKRTITMGRLEAVLFSEVYYSTVVAYISPSLDPH